METTVKALLRDNGLTIALTALFLCSGFGMIWSGYAVYNDELREHGATAIDVSTYLTSGNFLSALFENWESEFLQMSAYVMLTAILFQRGSAESRDPDDPDRPGDELSLRTGSRLLDWFYSYSLGIALALLFIASFGLHWWASLVATNDEAMLSWRPAAVAAQLCLQREVVVRIVSELAVGVFVDGAARRPLSLPAS